MTATQGLASAPRPEVLRLSLTFELERPVPLTRVEGVTSGIVSLFRLGVFRSEYGAEQGKERAEDDSSEPPEDDFPDLQIGIAWSQAYRAVQPIQVETLSLNSPLYYVLDLTAASSLVIGLGSQLLAWWRDLERTRTLRSKQKYERAVMQYVTAQVPTIPPGTHVHQILEDHRLTEIRWAAARAEQALSALREIDMDEPPEDRPSA